MQSQPLYAAKSSIIEGVKKVEVRTRFAPSPTGYLHIGGLRTALYCYLWAKKQNGKYLLRIEDTDQGRYVEGSVESLIRTLAICDLRHDEGPVLADGKIEQIGDFGPYYQSQRLEIYQRYVRELIGQGKAYYCFCTKERLEELREEQAKNNQTPKYDSKCSRLTKEEVEEKLRAGEPYVIRMKLPQNRDVAFDDVVRGHVVINTDDMDEQVLIKADGFPTYHFAVVVDDHLMEISHVIRGEEWLVSTPKHLLLYEAFGWQPPVFAHLPTVLNANKKKLSKRDGSAAVEDFLTLGYLPQALINYITMLGWSAPDGKEIFSTEEIYHEFSLDRINNSGAVFDVEKLNWVNAQYIKTLDNDALAQLILPYLKKSDIAASLYENKMAYIAECVKDRIHFLSEAVSELIQIFADVKLGEHEEVAEALAFETNRNLYEHLIELINEKEEITPDNLNEIFKVIQKQKGIKGKNLYMGARVALTGEVHGPDIKIVMCILGKDMVLSRLQTALNQL